MAPSAPAHGVAAGKSLGLARHFLVIGAQRSGTSWLYRNLNRHPDFWLAPVKEIHFFDRSPQYATPSHHALPPGWRRLSVIFTPSPSQKMVRRYLKPLTWYRKAETDRWAALWFSLSYLLSNIGPDWYRRLFMFGGDKITGDLTPGYSLLADEDVAVARELLPEARIVMVLRNPIERAWSNFKLNAQFYGFSLTDERAARRFFSKSAVFQRGDYASILRRWRRYFGPERFHLAYYEDLVEDPETLLRSILQFLGARSDPCPADVYRRVNASVPVEIPTDIRKALAQQYRDSLRELCRIEPGRAEIWLREAEHLGRGAPPRQSAVERPRT